MQSLLLLLLPLLVLGARAQTCYTEIYSDEGQTGNYVHLEVSGVANLSTYGMDDDIESVNQTGIWLYYENFYHNIYNPGMTYYVHGIDIGVTFPEEYQNIVTSLRHTGCYSTPNDAALTVFEGTAFAGWMYNTVRDATIPEGDGVSGNVSSIILIGSSQWTVYTVCSHVCLGTEAAAPAADKVIIPKRVQRAPTDVLKALAGTVKRDTSGPHYKYIDDPFLIPSSNMTKRSYALSKESGRKAARWVRDKHPKLFTHRPEEPFVESFFPKTKYHKDSEVTTDTLKQLVERGEVSDAITVYHLCKEKDVDLPEDVLQSLLELMCFYNCEEPLEGAWVEERWYRQASPTVRKTWKDQGLAEDLFAAMPNKGSAAFCAMIRGMSQYYQVDRAWQLYQECQEKAIPLDTGTYNSLIRVASMLRDSADLRWQLVKELLTAMAESGTKPDLGTLNATLEALTQMSAWRQAREWSLQVLAEFHQQGIQPSLATYYYLLTIHYRERGPASHILLDILDQIQGRSFTIQHPMDIHFFVTAMNVARNQLQSMEAARRIDDLLHVGDNHLFIGDSYKESVYYRHYFGLCCSTLPFDEFMEVYSELVPHVYTPEPGIMQEVLQAVKVSSCLHHLPQLWSDMILFDLALREKLVDLVLSALVTHYPDLSTEEEGLTARLAEVVKDIWARVQDQAPNRRNRLTWLGSMLGQALEVLVRFGEYSTAKEVLKEATTAPDTILGYLPYQPLASLLAAAIEKGDAETAVGVVLYGRDAGHLETGQMALKVTSSLSLTPRQRAQITSDLGFDTSAATP